MWRGTERREALGGLAETYTELGRDAEALEKYQHALEIACVIGDRRGLIGLHRDLAATMLKLGDIDSARVAYREALGVAIELGIPLEQGRAHEGLARCADIVGDSAGAIQHRTKVREFVVELDISETPPDLLPPHTGDTAPGAS